MKNKVLVYSLYNSFIGLKKKKIRGKGNNLNINPLCLFKKSTIRILGNNNEINIEEGVKLYNTQIIISGDDHKLTIEENCVIKDSLF